MLSPDFLFPRFLVFSRPILAIFHIAFHIAFSYSIRIPFLFQYRSIIFYVQVEHQEAVEEAVEFQDMTRVLLGRAKRVPTYSLQRCNFVCLSMYVWTGTIIAFGTHDPLPIST